MLSQVVVEVRISDFMLRRLARPESEKDNFFIFNLGVLYCIVSFTIGKIVWKERTYRSDQTAGLSLRCY